MAPQKVHLLDQLGDEVLVKGKDGKVKTASILELKDKTVGVYFSAHWCPPCRAFTPQLVTVYEKLKAAGENFEIVFVSSDRDQKQFDEYYASMPWMALPHKAAMERQAASSAFKVSSIPRLVIVAPDGEVLNDSARNAVAADPTGAKYPWKGESTETGLFNSVSPQFIVLMIVMLAWFIYNFPRK